MISCKEYATAKKKELKRYLSEEKDKPCLIVIQIGNNPQSNSYIRGKMKDCEEVGIECRLMKFETIAQSVLEGIIKVLNQRKEYHGIIVQLPVGDDIDISIIQELIAPEKDVDGFRKNSKFEPCTPLGIVNYLKYIGYEFEGKNALVIGRSDIVGKPLARMLTDLDATVTLAHSKSVNIEDLYSDMDVLFTCIDKIEHYNYSIATNRGLDIIDIGLGMGSDGKLHGNIQSNVVKHIKENEPNKICISGIGGVGLLTRVTLLENVVKAYDLQRKEVNFENDI